MKKTMKENKIYPFSPVQQKDQCKRLCVTTYKINTLLKIIVAGEGGKKLLSFRTLKNSNVNGSKRPTECRQNEILSDLNQFTNTTEFH